MARKAEETLATTEPKHELPKKVGGVSLRESAAGATAPQRGTLLSPKYVLGMCSELARKLGTFSEIGLSG